MTAKQQRFVEEYTIDGNGAAAAIRAGFTRKAARQAAYQLLKNENVVKAIKERWVSMAMTAEEATKRVSDIAATRLNDYINVEEVWETPMVKKHLSELIAELQFEIDLENEVYDRISAEMTDKEADVHHEEQAVRKRKILRYQVELELNPSAYRFVKGEPVKVRKPVVDLIALAQAEERGNIKKISFNERGLPSVEAYAADGALETILKLNGKLVNKVDHTSGGKSFGDFLMEMDDE